LLAAYSDYAWNLQSDHKLGERLIDAAVKASPKEATYRITQIRMLIAQGKYEEARASLEVLQTLNVGGHLDSSISELRTLLSRHQGAVGSAV
jgi:protein involved in temperature-dependent protein secretion